MEQQEWSCREMEQKEEQYRRRRGLKEQPCKELESKPCKAMELKEQSCRRRGLKEQ